MPISNTALHGASLQVPEGLVSFGMVEDLISEIGIDSRGGLFVKPATRAFPYIYREAMEVKWEPEGAYLYGPAPREWSFVDWFSQICSAASEQGVRLTLGVETKWRDLDEGVRRDIEKMANVA